MAWKSLGMALYPDLGPHHSTSKHRVFALARYGGKMPSFPGPSGILVADLGKGVNVTDITAAL